MSLKNRVRRIEERAARGARCHRADQLLAARERRNDGGEASARPDRAEFLQAVAGLPHLSAGRRLADRLLAARDRVSTLWRAS